MFLNVFFLKNVYINFYKTLESTLFTNSVYLIFFYSLICIFFFIKVNFIIVLLSNVPHVLNYLYIFNFYFYYSFKKIKKVNLIKTLLIFYFLGGMLWSYLLYNNYWNWDIIEVLGLLSIIIILIFNHYNFKIILNFIFIASISFKLYYLNFFSSLHIFKLFNLSYIKKNKNLVNIKFYFTIFFFMIRHYNSITLNSSNKIFNLKFIYNFINCYKYIKKKHLFYILIIWA